MTDGFSGNRAPVAAAEGRLGAVVAGHAARAMGHESPALFQRVVVEEVVFDPSLINDERAKFLVQELKIRDVSFVKNLPPNTILGRRVRDGTQTGIEELEYFFPFFSPHMMLPVKAGEHVWVFYEENKSNHFGFWISRITEPRDVDDINQTHADRKFHLDQKKSIKDAFERSADEMPSFDNGPTFRVNNEKQPLGVGASHVGGEKAYEKIIKESDAGAVHDLEAVPRFNKRPGDTVFQGSHNTLIVLGTDRTGASADVESTPKGKRAKGKPPADKKGNAGTIDIVVGRGRKSKTGAKKIVKNSLGKEEVSKHISNENANEGDPDFENDAARIYISMKTDPDKNFNVKLKGVSPEAAGDGVAAAVIKVDHMRIIVRETLKFLVQPEFNSPESECAGAVIKKDGNVVLIPAEKGILKLGGEDADIAVFGIHTSSGASAAGGKVTSPPLICTMGGALGVSGAHGVVATKVLVK